ncbi:MAG: diguanylate cyclase [Candidatus Calescibacterium sp.]|nr:diguanylate cyclase [Candidatus Calescibacterium sp.]MDW8086733.1 diguanylate cyclase [Candidatus Calescibacterium sp.]
MLDDNVRIEIDKLISIYSSVLELEDRIKVPGRKILIIDDSTFTRISIRNTIEKYDLFDSQDIIEADDGISGLKKFKENLDDLDLIVCDIRMKNFDGLQFIRTVKDMEKDYKMSGDIANFFRISIIPIIAITGTAPRSKIEALEAGAKDFVLKPTREITQEEFERELVARIRIHTVLKRSLERLIKTGENLYKTSIIDPLTGAFNRRYMKDILDMEIARALRKGTTLAVMILDIDDFKKINDTYGHPAGDKVLVELSRRIFNLKRPYDYSVRYGGDEFVLILPETRKEGIISFYDRLKKDLQENPITIDHCGELKRLDITFSAGGTFFPSNVVKISDEIFRVADNALYEAKRNGKCRIEIFL